MFLRFSVRILSCVRMFWLLWCKNEKISPFKRGYTDYLECNYSSQKARPATSFWDITAQLVDYGRSVLIDVPIVQSEAAKKNAANPVPRGAGPQRRGQGARYHGGSVGKLWPSEERSDRSDPGTFSTVYRPRFNHHTRHISRWRWRRGSV